MTLVDPQSARAAIGALLLRYNPAQRRDSDGKWTDGPGGNADLTRSNVDMSADERQFLSDYVEDGATYRRINDALRGQTPVTPEMADKVKRLDNLVGRASLDGDATLYRAMSVKSTDPIMGQVFSSDGGSWTDPGFGSASGDRSAVDDFRGVGDQAIVFEISAKKGQPVLVLGDDLSDRAMMQTPQEVLLPRGYRLEFDSVSSRRRDGIMVHTVKATLADPDPLVEAFAFNPNQRRGPDGRWIKMGGGTPAAVDAPGAKLRRGIDSGVAKAELLSGGQMATVQLVRFNDGSRAVRKTAGRVPSGRSPKDQADAEELSAKVAQAVGVKTPAIVRTGDAQTHAEYVDDGVPGMMMAGWQADQLADTPQGLRLGLLDFLIVNPDRNPGNWLTDDDGNIHAIDHGFAWDDELESAYGSPFARRFTGPENPLTPDDMARLRPRLEALRPEFERMGHTDWYDSMMLSFNWAAERVKGEEPLLEFAFNPNQRRGPKLPPGSSETSNGPGGTEAPPEFGVVTETTGDPSLGLRVRAATAAMELFGFNPHQLRGPDGKWIKMPTADLRNRRNERARARRAAKKAEKAAAAARPESDAPDQADAAHRRNRDDFNQKVAIEAVNVQNDNEFDGKPDARLDNRLDHLQKAIERNDPLVADEWADDLHQLLANDYPEVALPIKPRPPAPEGQSVQIDEAALMQRFKDALDDYNAEIHVMGKAWVDMLRDPEVRADPDSGLDHVTDEVVNELGSNVLALRKAILNSDGDMADLFAAQIRRILVSQQLQADHDFPQQPTIQELRNEAIAQARGVPVPPSKTSGLLTSGAPVADRIAALRAAAAAGTWGEEPIGQGAMGETKKVVFNDGTRAVYKKAKGDWAGSIAGDPWTPKHQTDAEEMASLVGAALGLRAPAVQRISDDEINMELVENAGPAMNRFFDKTAPDYVRVPDDLMGTDDALLMGLFDTLIDNPDRHGFNWMVDDQNRIFPIDHGLSFMNLKGSRESVAARSPFAKEYFVTPDGRYKENILTKRDIEYVRQQLAPLQAEFDRIGRQSWGVAMMQRLDNLSLRAKGGASHQLPAPRQE